MEWREVYIGLGSNLASPEQQIRDGIDALAALPFSQHLTVSPIYKSKPVGPQDQPDFVNAVAYFQTQLSPHGLLDELQRIELEQGRERLEHWGPRTLDLDILLYDTQVIRTERLTVPHPELKNRSFVYVPLADLAPNLVLPDGTKVLNLCKKGRNGLSLLETPTPAADLG